MGLSFKAMAGGLVAAVLMAGSAAAETPRRPLDPNFPILGECVWRGIGPQGQTLFRKQVAKGASLTDATKAFEQRPGFDALLAQCDPRHADHPFTSRALYANHAMRALALEVLLMRGFSVERLHAALERAPETRGQLIERVGRIISGDRDKAPEVNWTPLLRQLGVRAPNTLVFALSVFFESDVFETVLIYSPSENAPVRDVV